MTNIEIFKNDFFSKSISEFIKVDNVVLEEINIILEKFYPLIFSKLKSVYQFDSIEINSSNFYVYVEDNSKFVLKKLKKKSNIILFENQLNLAEEINKDEILLPYFIKNKEGNYLSKDKYGNLWVISKFINGEHFSGNIDNNIDVLNSIEKLFKQLFLKSDSKDFLNYDTKLEIKKMKNVYAHFSKSKNRWHKIFNEKDFQLIDQNHEIIYKNLENLKTSQIENSPIKTLHIDLHPLNIIITKNKKINFLDIDSLINFNYFQVLGFTIYKLCRQAITINKNNNDVINFFLSKKNPLFDENISKEIYENAAKLEILRRLSLILKLNFSKNDKWNFMIETQIRSLIEIEEIFKLS